MQRAQAAERRTHAQVPGEAGHTSERDGAHEQAAARDGAPRQDGATKRPPSPGERVVGDEAAGRVSQHAAAKHRRGHREQHGAGRPASSKEGPSQRTEAGLRCAGEGGPPASPAPANPTGNPTEDPQPTGNWQPAQHGVRLSSAGEWPSPESNAARTTAQPAAGARAAVDDPGDGGLPAAPGTAKVRIHFDGVVRDPPLDSKLDLLIRGARADLERVVGWRELAPAGGAA
jgi:hypothetical protein